MANTGFEWFTSELAAIESVDNILNAIDSKNYH